ncbi:MAG: hypothetical protein HYS45_01770 [Parcubacteria group bacterium]|nr:hypothetical protein [Parcubacteria group bacterium]
MPVYLIRLLVVRLCPILSHDLGIDVIAASREKIAKNAHKYPVDKALGKHAKYTEL